MKKLFFIGLAVCLAGLGGVSPVRADAEGVKGQQELAARVKADAEAKAQAQKKAREAAKEARKVAIKAQRQAMKAQRRQPQKPKTSVQDQPELKDKAPNKK